MPPPRKANIAFTLAEGLITLGIIGIVVVFTIPLLIQNHNEKVAITRLKATYSILNEAVKLGIVENESVNNWCNTDGVTDNTKWIPCTYNVFNNILKNIKALKTTDCHKAVKGRMQYYCFAQRYTNRFNDRHWEANSNLDHPAFVLNNGTVVTYFAQNGDGDKDTWCTLSTNDILKDRYTDINTSYWRYTGNCGAFMVDINGPKGPNVDGKDLFGFFLYRDGIAPMGRTNEHSIYDFEKNCEGKNFRGFGSCSAWVIYNNNLDYLHCNDLNWSTKQSCK